MRMWSKAMLFKDYQNPRGGASSRNTDLRTVSLSRKPVLIKHPRRLLGTLRSENFASRDWARLGLDPLLVCSVMMMTDRVPIPRPLDLPLTLSPLSPRFPPTSTAHLDAPVPGKCVKQSSPLQVCPVGGLALSSHRARSLCQTHPLRYRLTQGP